jgi:hypothetical protein
LRKVIASEFVSLDGTIETPVRTFPLTGEEQPPAALRVPPPRREERGALAVIALIAGKPNQKG